MSLLSIKIKLLLKNDFEKRFGGFFIVLAYIHVSLINLNIFDAVIKNSSSGFSYFLEGRFLNDHNNNSRKLKTHFEVVSVAFKR